MKYVIVYHIRICFQINQSSAVYQVFPDTVPRFGINLHLSAAHSATDGIVDSFDTEINLKILSPMIFFLVLSPIIVPNTRHHNKNINHIDFVN